MTASPKMDEDIPKPGMTRNDMERAAYICRKNADEWERSGDAAGADYRSAEASEWLEMAELWDQALSALESRSGVLYTKADMEAACEVVLAGFRSKPMLDKMVDRFLAWPLPFSVCADLVATKQSEGRIGTNLLTAIEARQMLEHVLSPRAEPGAPSKDDERNRQIGIGLEYLRRELAEPEPAGAQDNDRFNCGVEGKPCQRWCGANACLTEHEPDHAAEQERIETAGTTPETGLGQTKPASAAPEVAAPDQNMEQYVGSPAPDLTAAAPDVKGIAKRLREYRCADPWAGSLMFEAAALLESLSSAHAREFAEGLEEAAKVCEQNIYGTDEFQFGSRTCAAAIRAKINPTRGET